MKTKKVGKQNKNNSNKKKAVYDSNIQSKYYFFLFAILLLTFVIYRPIFFNGFVWDDGPYVQNNPTVQLFHLKNIFFNYEMGNYHPLTMLIFAIEYFLFGLNETGFHAVNLIIHLFNIILVFYAIFRLNGNSGIALFVSLFFAIHPLHVESVAWVSALKDLLYTFFFLGSYIYYLKYIQSSKNKFYVISFLLFLASTLSKAMAVCLPVLFILTDYFKGRKIDLKKLIEKLPFFLLSFIIGIIAILAQKSSGSIQEITNFTFFEQIIFASYGFVSYIIKSFIPLNLSAYYPYPIKSGGSIPLLYIIYFLIFPFLMAAVLYTYRSTKKVIFGIGFYAITVFLVLQLLPVGGTIMADRYSYIPLIGVFYIAGEGMYLWWEKKFRFVVISLTSIFIIFFSIKTYERCGVWKNGMTLWNDVILKNQNTPVAYNNRGIEFGKENKYKEALNDFNKAVELLPGYANAYNNRGHLLMDGKQFELAKEDYNKAVELQPNDPEILLNRGNLFQNMGKINEAFNDYSSAIRINPDFAQAYYSRGLLMMHDKKNILAYNDFSKSIKITPSFTEAYVNRGNVLQEENRYEEAISDYNKAIEFDPGNSKAYYNRGNIFANQKKFSEAIADFSTAIKFRSDYALAYFGRGIAEINYGKKEIGCLDLQYASNLGFGPANEAISQLCH